MSIVTPNDFKKGMCIRFKDQLCYIVDYHRGRTGMRRPYVNTKLKTVETGSVLEETFSSDDKFESVFMEKKPLQYLYRNGDKYVFMDLETFEQPELNDDAVGHVMDLLKENGEVNALIAENRIISVELPDFIELKVTEAPPHIKGDTATAEYRKVTVETGGQVMAPPHIKDGDVIQIDTRTREYLKRISN